MKDFRLVCAFHSTVDYMTPDRPVAMAYAFSDWDQEIGDDAHPDAQNLKLANKTVSKGSLLYFAVIDTAKYPAGTTPPEVTAITIKCTKANSDVGDSPFVADPRGHNGWWINKTSLTARPGASDSAPVSKSQGYVANVACNVIGRVWEMGPFTAFKEGGYEFTVTVELSNGRQFEVDPEMVVGDG